MVVMAEMQQIRRERDVKAKQREGNRRRSGISLADVKQLKIWDSRIKETLEV